MPGLTTARRAVRAATPALALGTAALTAVLAACSDSPMAPTAGAPRFAQAPGTSAGQGGSASATLSRKLVGDTTVTTFVLGTDGKQADIVLDASDNNEVNFPLGLYSVCDPTTSSYGAGTWDSPCTAAAKPITITAKVWTDKASGKTATDFQPALRFVPGQKWPVQLYLKDTNYQPGDVIWWCPAGATYTTGSGTSCVNEGLTDPSLSTNFGSAKGWAYRNIKHFSGYLVSWGRQ